MNNKTPGSVHFLHNKGTPMIGEARIDSVLVRDCVWRAVLDADGKYPWQAVRRIDVLDELNRYLAAINGAAKPAPVERAQAITTIEKVVPQPLSSVAAPVVNASPVAIPAPQKINPFAKSIARMSGDCAPRNDPWSKAIARVSAQQEQANGSR
jgi:hypothetical protein